ncbi:MAG: AbrB/MazE/SpoVT family DNA-binding domain-containing protein [bacterium]
MKTYKVSSQGRITIPKDIRTQFEIKPGTRIHFSQHGNQIILEPITARFYRNLRGSLKGSGVLESLIAERKKDQERELNRG